MNHFSNLFSAVKKIKCEFDLDICQFWLKFKKVDWSDSLIDFGIFPESRLSSNSWSKGFTQLCYRSQKAKHKICFSMWNFTNLFLVFNETGFVGTKCDILVRSASAEHVPFFCSTQMYSHFKQMKKFIKVSKKSKWSTKWCNSLKLTRTSSWKKQSTHSTKVLEQSTVIVDDQQSNEIEF
jgi:hypothetical protein